MHQQEQQEKQQQEQQKEKDDLHPNIKAPSSLLPIAEYRSELIDAVRRLQFLVVVGDTGSGKTTQLPQYVLDDALTGAPRRVAVTQPRRIAAISAATRVAEEMHVALGKEVGFAIRFERCVSPGTTRLTYMTDGVLLRQCMADRTLSAFDLVILDEAHERSIETDILFGLLRRACRARPDLKVVVMSATLDIDKFCDFFGGCPFFSVPGRTFAIDVLWQKQIKFAVLKSTYVARSVDTVVHIHETEPAGDVLVFLTGQHEIETAMRMLNEALDDREQDTSRPPLSMGIVVYPIYSSMESLEQRAIFHPPPPGIRKVVFATNIAQTSVTVPGIRYVVDSGFVKQKMYDPKTHMDALVVVPVSQAAATQRAGRAGRTEHGRVYRLYSREAFAEMAPCTIPEIQRSSLLGTILELKRMGIDDILNFEFIDPPDPALVIAAIKQLFLLSAVDEHGHITPLGTKMAEFPVSPFLAHAIISAAQDFDCVDDVATIAAILSSEDVFMTPRSKRRQQESEEAHRRFHHSSGDHMTLLRIYREWEASDESRDWCVRNFMHYRAMKHARSVRSQLLETVRKLRLHKHSGSASSNIKSSDASHTRPSNKRAILMAFCAGFYVNTAKRHPQRPFFFHYLGAGGAGSSATSSVNQIALYIHPQSSLFFNDPFETRLDWIIYNDIQFVNRANMRVVSRIDFPMVQVLMGRNRLMDEERLVKMVLAMKRPRRPSWVDMAVTTNTITPGENQGSNTASRDPRESKTGDTGDNEFELVHEILDEQHHTERITSTTDLLSTVTDPTPLGSTSDLNPVLTRVSDLGGDDVRRLNLEGARQRYLQRKKQKR